MDRQTDTQIDRQHKSLIFGYLLVITISWHHDNRLRDTGYRKDEVSIHIIISNVLIDLLSKANPKPLQDACKYRGE